MFESGGDYDDYNMQMWRMVDGDNDETVATCGCGQEFTASQWVALPLLGVMEDEGWPDLELRNCQCGSTVSKEVSDG